MKKYTYAGVLLGLACVAASYFGAWRTERVHATPVPTTPQNCGSPVHKDTTVGVAAGNCPSSQQTGRRFITLCNSAENTGSPTVKIRIDGTAPVTGLGNPGDVISVGACVTYNAGQGIVPQCIASAATTHVTSLECQ